ncbi:MAG: hypothetical protein ACJ8AW_49380, partial [Rhodopila sp.]
FLVFVALITGQRPDQGVQALMLGEDDRYSNSKVQMVAWMGAVLIIFIGTCFLRCYSGMRWQDATNVVIASNLLTIAASAPGQRERQRS